MKAARLIDYKKFEFTDSDIKEPSDGECLLKVKVVSEPISMDCRILLATTHK